MIPMRDGVLLATDIYFPQDLSGPFPVLLYRTPYNKSAPSANERTAAAPTIDVYPTDLANFFAPHGYVLIYQDCRGRYLSEGKFVKYLSDGQDGYDTIDWIVNQTWSNGKVAMHGMSYPAHNAMAALCAAHPALRTAIIDMGGFSNSYHSGTRQGGALELKQVTWAWKSANDSPEVKNNATLKEELNQINIFDWFNAASMPWKKGFNPLSETEEYEDYLLAQWQNGNFTDYWKQLGIYAEGFYDAILDYPMIHMSGWYDVYAQTAIENYLGLTKQQGRAGPVRLILGPWMHGTRSRTYVGDVDFGTNATLDTNLAVDYKAFRLSWFDWVLKGIGEKMAMEPNVKIFVMGGGSGNKIESGRLDHGGYWRDESDWPIPRTVYTPYYLSSDFSLSTSSPTEEANVTYLYDPNDPVPSIGGTITSGAPIMIGGAFNQVEDSRFYPASPPYQPLADRGDVLVFMTDILTQDVEVTGVIEANLYVSSDRLDTDFTVKLIDVYPPSADYPEGFALNIQDGILRARYRNQTWDSPQLLTPYEIYPITIRTFPTSNLFKQGHRLRLDISSSNFPHFDLNPNTGEPEGLSTYTLIATNTIYMGGNHNSHILLPIIPPS